MSPPCRWGCAAAGGLLEGAGGHNYTVPICSDCTLRLIQTILVERTTIEAALDPTVTHAGRLVQDRHLHRAARPGVGNVILSDN